MFLLWFVNGSASSSYKVPDIRQYVLQIEKKYSIPEFLLDAIIQQESNYVVKALNPDSREGVRVSSFGLGQLTLPTAETHCKLNKQQVYHPIKNIECSAKVLKWQLIRYKGNIKRAVAAYQWGTPCECDGQVFTQRFKSRTRICLKKGNMTPMVCKRRGTFWNQWYVDQVLRKRTLSRNKIKGCFERMPCKTKVKKWPWHKVLNWS